MNALRTPRTLFAFFMLGGAALAVTGCTTDFDRFLGDGGAGQGGAQQSSSNSSGGGGSTTVNMGGGGSDPCDGKDCTDDNACTDDSCVDGDCVHDPAATPDPVLAPNVAGDCKKPICNADLLGEENDDTEVPTDDGNECTLDMCVAGNPHPNEMMGLACATGFCDGAGTCKTCNDAGDCGTAPCVDSFVCMDAGGGTKACVPTFTSDGTPVGMDVMDGDCQRPVCDGAGNIESGDDDTDPPADPIPTNCFHQVCNNGNVEVEDEADGHLCDDGGGQVQTGRCINGTCEDCIPATIAIDCNAGQVCDDNDNCCTRNSTATTCAAVGCGTVDDNCDQATACPNTCGPNTVDGPLCKTNACGCNAGSDCGDTFNGPRCNSSKCGCNNGPDCSTNNRGPNCSGGKCGCGADNDCGDNEFGPDCIAGGGCGCDGGTACGTNVNGPDCLGNGRCGCDIDGDCAASAQGHLCVNKPTGTCGCAATTDCAAGTCDTTLKNPRP